MRKCLVIAIFTAVSFIFISFTQQEDKLSAAKLRRLYSQSQDKWPAPTIDAGVQWKELGIIPESPIEKYKDSMKHIIELGKTLFFDTRLSGSGKISCATCHQRSYRNELLPPARRSHHCSAQAAWDRKYGRPNCSPH